MVNATEVAECVLVVLAVVAHATIVAAREFVEARVHWCHAIDLAQVGIKLFHEFLETQN